MEVMDLSGKGQVVEELEHGFELVEVISAILELPEVVVRVPRVFSCYETTRGLLLYSYDSR